MLFLSKTITNLFQKRYRQFSLDDLRKNKIKHFLGADPKGQLHVFTMVFSVLRTSNLQRNINGHSFVTILKGAGQGWNCNRGIKKSTKRSKKLVKIGSLSTNLVFNTALVCWELQNKNPKYPWKPKIYKKCQQIIKSK